MVKRHWLIVSLLAILVGGGAYYAGRQAVPQYRSRLTVQINSPKQVFARLDDIDVDELALQTDPILSEALVLTTQGLALEVVDGTQLQIGLADPAVFRGRVMTGILVDSGGAPPGEFQLEIDTAGYRLMDAFGAILGTGTLDQPVVGPGFSFTALTQDPALAVGLQVVPRRVAAGRVSAGLSYRVRDGTNAVDLWYTDTDPTLAPVVLRRAAFLLRTMGVRRAIATAAARRSYVENQLLQSTAEFQASLRELQEYKEGQQITDLGAQELAVVQTIRQLEQDKHAASVQVSTIGDAMARSDSIDVETLNRLAAVDGIGANAALNFQITGLLERYDERNGLTAGALGFNENNPQVTAVDQQIRQGHRALRSAVTATLNSIGSRIEAIDREIQRQRNILAAFPSMESRIGQLNLESNILNETQRYLLGQYQAARMQEATIAPYIEVIDDASPAFNVGTSVQQRMLLGVLVGLLLGLAAAFFLEYLDQTIKSPSDIERVLGVPVLGIIPLDQKLAPRSSGSALTGATISSLDPDEPAVEAYRALRTNVTFVGAEKPLQFVAVTSPGPREGKTTTAINLALTLAQNGRKTILVDGDLRRSTVHRAFGLVQDPGLTDVLVGNVSAAEAVRPEVAPSLDLLPSGSTPPNPSELLGSSAMDALVMELRHDYEYIIMDTPPTLPVTDAAVVSITADATMLVVRSGDTEETAAQRALEQLRRVGARIAGAVLNAITHRKDPQYSYYSYRKDPPQVRSRMRAVASRVAGLK